ncbi:MAG: hypothetical protein ACXADA_17060 [Candidatus Hodarchaeales archaeon]|jgi:hypothetical protein
MKKYKTQLIFILLVSILFFQFANSMVYGYPESNKSFESPLGVSETTILEVTVNVTCPTGYSMPGKTPVIVNLSSIAENLPASVDVFGKETPEEGNDDIKWDAVYVIYNETLIPSQVDDMDGISGFSEGDELLFQLPQTLNLDSGESDIFKVYIANKEFNLPPPSFDENCTVYEYPMKEVIYRETDWGTDMIQESYYIENGAIRACTLVEAAWSSGSIYELSILETGWDVIKMQRDFPSESWKWTRFATLEPFVEQNSHADKFPFYTTRIITGPVRAQIQMQSIASYGMVGVEYEWGPKPNLFALVTYDLYAGLPWLDYTLETVGPNATNYPELDMQIKNKEYDGGSASTNHRVYIPGQDYLDRDPDSIGIKRYQKEDFTDPWYAEKLSFEDDYFLVGKEEPYFADWTQDDFHKAGHGMIFDDTGFDEIRWKKGSQEVSLWFDSMQSPFRARYLPFDKSVTGNAISYMNDQYSNVWERPDPSLTISSTTISVEDLPFDYISVSIPNIPLKWIKVGEKLSITNVTAISSALGEIDDMVATSHTYEIFDTESRTTVHVSDLTWDSNSSSWEATDIDLSSLTKDKFYKARVVITTGDIKGASQYSSKFWYGDSEPPVDLLPPVISGINQNPPAAIPVHFSTSVNVSCAVTDDDSGVDTVSLSYSNTSGIWYNTPMTFGYGQYTGTIPSEVHSPSITIYYKITATDMEGNSNTTEILSYVIALQYQPGQGLIPLLGLSGLAVGAIAIAFFTRGMHRQKYDKID